MQVAAVSQFAISIVFECVLVFTVISSVQAPHPLGPLRANEVYRASKTLLQHLRGAKDQVRFKVIDLTEPPKHLCLRYLYENGPVPDRKARIYFHRKNTTTLSVAIVNITRSAVEKDYGVPDAQGAVDWVEYELVHNACLEHPDVKAEIAKIKLPPNANVLNDSWAYGTDDRNERRRLFQCYMYAALSDDPESNHYSIPLPLAPVFDAHTLELVALECLPMRETADLDPETQPWEPVKPVEYSAGILGPDAFRKDVKPL